jgi:hypothetical protein
VLAEGIQRLREPTCTTAVELVEPASPDRRLASGRRWLVIGAPRAVLGRAIGVGRGLPALVAAVIPGRGTLVGCRWRTTPGLRSRTGRRSPARRELVHSPTGKANEPDSRRQPALAPADPARPVVRRQVNHGETQRLTAQARKSRAPIQSAARRTVLSSSRAPMRASSTTRRRPGPGNDQDDEHAGVQQARPCPRRPRSGARGLTVAGVRPGRTDRGYGGPGRARGGQVAVGSVGDRCGASPNPLGPGALDEPAGRERGAGGVCARGRGQRLGGLAGGGVGRRAGRGWCLALRGIVVSTPRLLRRSLGTTDLAPADRRTSPRAGRSRASRRRGHRAPDHPAGQRSGEQDRNGERRSARPWPRGAAAARDSRAPRRLPRTPRGPSARRA